MRKTLSSMAAALVALAAAIPSPAPAAATFTVNPLVIAIEKAQGSGVLSITNTSLAPLRLQVEVTSWSQTEKDATVSLPSKDIVVYPPIIEIQPTETRQIRIGFLSAPGPVEKAYRVYFREIPQPNSIKIGVAVVTRVGIPVFVAPTAKADMALAASSATARPEGVGVTIKNTGNIHAIFQTAKIVPYDAGGHAMPEQQINSWYVLAGSEREFVFPMKGACGVKKVAFAFYNDRGLKAPISEGVDVQNACNAKAAGGIRPGRPGSGGQH